MPRVEVYIFHNNSVPTFSGENLCNIYLNIASLNGNDLYTSQNMYINVAVDTFTVIEPDEFFVYPSGVFTISIQTGLIEQVSSDLYVDPLGSNSNSGLFSNEPLKTISYALLKIIPDPENPVSIFLSNGIYSYSQTGEIFPINCRNYISLIGTSEGNTIIDGEGIREILICYDESELSIEDLTVTNSSGAGIKCLNSSSPHIENVIISSCSGNGIYCADNSNATILNAGISNNLNSGIHCSFSSPTLQNIDIFDNIAELGGGLYCYEAEPILENILISGNSAEDGGGIYCSDSMPILVDVTISGNSAASEGGGVYLDDCVVEFEQCEINDNNSFDQGGGVYCTYKNDTYKT